MTSTFGHSLIESIYETLDIIGTRVDIELTLLC